MASPTRGRRESTGSLEGGTEAQEPGAEGKKSRGRACRGGRRGTTTPGTPCGLRRMRLAGNSGLTAPTGQWDAGESPDPDSQRPMAVQGRRGFLTAHLALGKTTFKRSCGAKFWRVGRREAEGAAASPRAVPGEPGSSRGARRTSPGAGSGAGPGLVVERLLIHHGGRGGRWPSLSSAGAGAGSWVLRLRSPSVVHGPHLQGEAGSRGGVPGM